MGDKKKIDELYKRQMRSFEATPPADSWAAIEGRLSADRRKKKAAWWQWASIAAALVLAFFSGYMFRFDQNEEMDRLKQSGETSPVIIEKADEEKGMPGLEKPSRNETEQRDDSPASQSPGEEPEADEEQSTVTLESVSDQKTGTTSRNKAEAQYAGESRPSLKINSTDLASSQESQAETTEPLVQQSDQHYFAAEETVNTEEPSTVKSSKDQEQIGNARISRPVQKATPPIEQQPESFIAERAIEDHENSAKEKEAATLTPDPVLLVQQEKMKSNTELNKDKEQVSAKGFSITALASPSLAFRDVDINSNTPFIEENVANESVSNSYAAGIDVSFRQENRLEWEAGVHLSSWVQASENTILAVEPSAGNNLNTEASGNTSSGFVNFNNGTSPGDIAKLDNQNFDNAYVLVPVIEQEYRFIEFPISLGYYLLDTRHWAWKIKTGISPRILRGSDVNLQYPDGSTRPLNELQLNNFSLQLLASTGVKYKINRRFSLHLSPSLQYGITPVNQHPEVDTYFHQFLIFSGLGYNF